MSRGEAWFMHVTTALIAVTGFVYAWMRYFATPSDPFAIVNHPAQPTFQHAHVLFAPLWIFAVGFVFKSHVLSRLRSGKRMRRRSGITLLTLSLPMAASGYLLQVSSDPFWMQAWMVLHVASSIAFVVIYAAHLLTPRRGAVTAARGAGAEPDTEPGSSPHTPVETAG